MAPETLLGYSFADVLSYTHVLLSNGNVAPSGAMFHTENVVAYLVERPKTLGLKIGHVNDMALGDRLVFGKRSWKYTGRSEDIKELSHEQNEYVFEAAHDDPGACGRRRVHSQSEIEAFMAAGFLRRTVEALIKLQ